MSFPFLRLSFYLTPLFAALCLAAPPPSVPTPPPSSPATPLIIYLSPRLFIMYSSSLGTVGLARSSQPIIIIPFPPPAENLLYLLLFLTAAVYLGAGEVTSAQSNSVLIPLDN